MLCFLCGVILSFSILIAIAAGAAKLLSWILEIGLMTAILLFGIALYFAGLLLTTWTLTGVVFTIGIAAIAANTVGGDK